MREIIGKASCLANKKPIYDKKLNHLAGWRTSTEKTKYTEKLGILFQLIQVRQQVVDDMHKICIQPKDVDSEYRIDYVSLLDLATQPALKRKKTLF